MKCRYQGKHEMGQPHCLIHQSSLSNLRLDETVKLEAECVNKLLELRGNKRGSTL